MSIYLVNYPYPHALFVGGKSNSIGFFFVLPFSVCYMIKIMLDTESE